MKMPKLPTEKFVETISELKKPLIVVALLWGLSFVILLASSSAKASLRCDCSEVVANCSATVSMRDMRVSIESDSDSCSRVDYLIEGQPFAALVVGGSSELNWPGQPLREPRIVVENCRVCAEAGDRNAAAVPESSASEDEATQGELAPIVKVMPTYPREAWTNLIEGIVTVEFDVTAAGRVEKVRVVDASNPIFVNNAVEAVSRFRYMPKIVDGEAVPAKNIREQLVFRVLDGTDPVVTSKTL